MSITINIDFPTGFEANSPGSMSDLINDAVNQALQQVVAAIPAIPNPLADLGATTFLSTTYPFILYAGGQSNMCGRDDGGSKFVASGIYMTNDFLNPTAIVPAAYGVAPLNLSKTQSVTTNPTLCVNNQAIAFANMLRAFWAGTPQANRHIVIVWNCLGAQDIRQWVGSATASPLWVNLLTAVSVVNQAYPNFTFDHGLWDQGEGNAADSFSVYEGFFTTLMAQFRALSCWRTTTTFAVTELLPWYNNTQQQRNDFLYAVRQGLYDPYVSFTSGAGLVPSTENPPFHYDGNSLQALGMRHFAVWNAGRLSGAYSDNGSFDPDTGGAHVIPRKLATDGTNQLTIQPDDLRGRGCYVDATLGGTIGLPPAVYMSECDIYIFAGANVTLTAASLITFENAPQATTGSLTLPLGLSSAVYRVYALPTKATWVVESVWPRQGASLAAYYALNAGAQELTPNATRHSIVSMAQSVVTIDQPADGSDIFFYNTASGESSITLASAGQIFLPNGDAFTTYPVPPNSQLMMRFYRGHAFVSWQSHENSRFTQISVTPSSGVTLTCAGAIGDLTIIVTNTTTLAAATVVLPNFPVDGAKITFILSNPITAVTWTQGTFLTTPTGLPAGHTTIVFSKVAGSKWVA